MSGSPALTGASFAYPKLTDPFFTPTTYVGAFDGTNDWTNGWANFDPQNTDYTCGITATENAANNMKVALFPNPTANEVTLQIGVTTPTDLTINVTNLTGRVIETRNLKNVAFMQTLNFNTTAWANGIYFVQISNGDNNMVQKMIVQH